MFFTEEHYQAKLPQRRITVYQSLSSRPTAADVTLMGYMGLLGYAERL